MRSSRQLPNDLWTSETLIELPLPVKWTAVGLRAKAADDHGRGTTTDWTLRYSLWPMGEVSADDLVEHLLRLEEAGVLILYADSRRGYFQLIDWPAVSHASASAHPSPLPEDFRKAAGTFPEVRSALERGRGRGSEREWARGPAQEFGDDQPPDPFCRVHMPEGTTEDCRHCGTRRMALDLWKTGHGRE